MCVFSAPSIPSAPPPPPSMNNPATNAEVTAAAEAERRRAANAKGRASTILTGGAGVTDPAPVERPALKALLG